MYLKNDGSDFNIKNTWILNNNNEKEKNNDAQNHTPNNANINNRKGSAKSNQNDLNSILNNAGKLAVGQNSYENLLDDKLANNIVKNLIQENKISKPPISKNNSSGRNERIDKFLSDNNPPPIIYRLYYKKNNNLFVQKANEKKPPTKGDNDLMGSMVSRLKQLEMTCHNQREEIKEKMKTINQLTEEISLFKSLNNGKKEELSEIKKLKDENSQFKKQINEMENFLKDYGLKWVGENNKLEGEFKVEDVKKQLECSKPLYKNNLPKEIDMNVIIRRIDELNIVMEKSGSHEVFKDKDGAFKMRKLDPIVMGFYKNGLIIQGYNFHPYSSKEAQEILEDVLDGYFPLILKKKYPDGVLFKVLDKLDEIYAPSKKNKLGDLNSVDEECLKPLDKEEFLKQFPKTYIKNGKVISVRDEIAKKIEGKSDNLNNLNNASQKKIDAPGFQDGILEMDSEKLKSQKGINEESITILKIRTEDGKKTIILKLLPSEKMETVYEMIISVSENKKFELVSNFTKTTFSPDSQQTLEGLGLHPSSALQMRPLK